MSERVVGETNRIEKQQNGNANLKWAFSEAACLFIRDNEYSKEYHRKLVNRYGRGKSLSIIAHKLARATSYILKRRFPFSYKIFYAGKVSGIREPTT